MEDLKAVTEDGVGGFLPAQAVSQASKPTNPSVLRVLESYFLPKLVCGE